MNYPKDRLVVMGLSGTLVAVVISCTLLMAGCGSTSDKQLHALEYHGAADLKHVKSDELQSIMIDLDLTVYHQQDSGMDVDPFAAADNIAQQGRWMADEIVNLLESDGAFGLDGLELTLFEKYTHQLRDKSDGIKMAVDARRESQLNPMINDLVNTCNDCHKLFRTM